MLRRALSGLAYLLTAGYLRRSFYLKIAAGLLALLLAMLSLELFILDRFWKRFWVESEQRLHWNIASTFAERLLPAIQDGAIDYGLMRELMFDLRELYPRFELYLLDEEGVVRSHFGGGLFLVTPKVDLAPLKEHLAHGSTPVVPLFAKDPDAYFGIKESVFSVARLPVGAEQWYLFVPLYSENSSVLRDLLSFGMMLRASGATLGLSFAATLAAGLFIFALLTKRLRTIAATATAFAEGDFDRRIESTGRDEIGRLGSSFNTMADTIERYIAALRHEDSLRRSLIGNVSSALRQPLKDAEQTLEHLLSGALHERGDRRRALETSAMQTEQLVQLVHELFELAKLEAKDTVPNIASFALLPLVELAGLRFEGEAEDKGLCFTLETPEELPPVLGDRQLLERALGNLLAYAVAVTREGQIALRLRAEEKRVMVEVADNGPVLNEQQRVRLFSPDREGSSARDVGGGLGLAIAHAIIEAHGSKIDVAPLAGGGNCYSFWLRVDGGGSNGERVF